MNTKLEKVGDFEYFTGNLLGHGAFACVYKGRYRKNHNLVVAIKSIMKKNLSKSQNLLGKEIKILKELTELHHENVVALLDCKETPTHVFLVMEFCNGGDLADYLQVKGTLSEDTIRLFLRQLAGAMRALNAKGIVHRDLKPQNILLCHFGTKSNPPPHEIKLKIADFGFARFLQDGVMAATLCGSPMYMAPEVIMSLQYDAKADLWSIGTIVFQCLTGKAPFQAQTPQALKLFYEKNVNLTPKIPCGTSPELADLLVRLLKRNAKDRLEFDEFFSHEYLKKVMPTSPVPVPARQHSLSREMSPASKNVSPLSGVACPYSPADACEEELPGEVMASATSGSSPYDRVRLAASNNKGQASPSSTEGLEDYVIVPSNVPSENSSGETQGTGFLKRKSAEIFGSSPLLAGNPTKMSSSPSSGQLHHPKKYSSPNESPSPRPSYLSVNNSPSPNTAIPNVPSQPIPIPSQPIPIPSQPIPVPSQKLAYEQIQKSLKSSVTTGSPSSLSTGREQGTSNTSIDSAKQQWENSQNDSASAAKTQMAGTPDLTSLTPPPVQFMMGTPPMVPRRTSNGSMNSNTPPPMSPWPCVTSPFSQARHLTNSPIRKNNAMATSPNSNYFFSNLPTITDAQSNKCPPGSAPAGVACNPFFNFGSNDHLYGHAMTSPSQPLVVPFGTRDSGAEAGVNFMEAGANLPFAQRAENIGRTNDSYNGLRSVISNPNFQASGGSPARNSIIPFTRHSGSLFFDHEVFRDSNQSPFGGRRDTGSQSSVPGSNHLEFDTSPSFMDDQVFFVAPELAEETIMEKDHNEILAKLNFVSALVDCIIDLAKTRGAPFAALSESVIRRDSKNNPVEVTAPVVSENCRRAEQLVLYFRALQLLSASLNLSREELKTRRLQPSSCVKSVVTNMNKKYHHCLKMCKSLNSQNLLQAATNDPRAAAITADKLLYNYAIEMCQSAAMEELFGQPQVCFRSYQTAQILLHSLAQQINNENDRFRLNKYKDAVEKRLYLLQQQGFVYSYDTSIT